jgi:hypothetical protein
VNNHNRKKRLNKFGFIGVTYDEKKNKWIAKIAETSSIQRISNFNTSKEAVLAWNSWAIELFGEFIDLNVIEP